MSERIDEKEFICVICPNSCRLNVWRDPTTDEIMVKGNQCARGKTYGIEEYTSPVRMLITTMRIEDGVLPVIPVRSVRAIPKGKVFDAVKVVNTSHCHAPIKMGDVVIENILGTNIDVIASRDMDSSRPLTKAQSVEEAILKKFHSTLLKGFFEDKEKLSVEEHHMLQAIESKLIDIVKQEAKLTE